MGSVGDTAGPRDGAEGSPSVGATPDSLGRCPDQTVLDVAPAELRRLSSLEYENTLRDLGLVTGSAPISEGFSGDRVIGGAARGFLVGGTVDEGLARNLLNTAMEVAASAASDLENLTGCTPNGTSEERDCVSEFIASKGRRLFRRPLAKDEVDALLGVYDTTWAVTGHRAGVEAVLVSMLIAPEFLYLFEDEPEGAKEGDIVPVSDLSAASRLSYFLWDSAPDEALLARAEAGDLHTAEAMEEEARRMLEDPKAKRTVARFFAQWAEVDTLEGMSKDETVFANFDGVREDLSESFMKTWEDAFWGEDGTLGGLLTGTTAYVNDAVAPLFGVDAGSTELTKMDVSDGHRTGFLTHPAFLAITAKPGRSDPIHRGLFVREQLLCMDLPDPPAADSDGNAIVFDIPEPEPGATNRDRFADHTARAECAACHALLDPIGFGFENFDAVGRYREQDEFGADIDTTGEVKSGGDLSGTFDGAAELATAAAESNTIADCFTLQWFRFSMDRREGPEDTCSNASALTHFLDKGKSLPELAVGIVRSDAFRHRVVGGKPQ
ncbi:MAG: DUF1592 domain-containing protein [Myxococcales bacterium]|nr:DUF1592 domain-containing protein [Myxococcales bacterium]